MYANLGEIYDDTISILNKLDARDSQSKTDEYFVTVIDHCMWSLVTTRTVESDGTVTIGTSHRVQIPENESYKPYKEWKIDKEGFTIRAGDYVVKGEVTEDVTSGNFRAIVKQYEPDAFEVQTFRDATKGKGFRHSVNGINRFIEPYIIEG